MAAFRPFQINHSKSFVKNQEGNPAIKRFFRTLKEQLLWLRDYDDEESLLQALHKFIDRYNAYWIMQRHGYRTPQQVYEEWSRKLTRAS